MGGRMIQEDDQPTLKKIRQGRVKNSQFGYNFENHISPIALRTDRYSELQNYQQLKEASSGTLNVCFFISDIQFEKLCSNLQVKKISIYFYFSWEGCGTLDRNIYKPSQDLLEATLLGEPDLFRVFEILWYKQTSCYFIIRIAKKLYYHLPPSSNGTLNLSLFLKLVFTRICTEHTQKIVHPL